MDWNHNDIFNSGVGIAWNDSLWVAIGNGDNHSIATSPDGKNWNPVENSNNIFDAGYHAQHLIISDSIK